MSRIEERGEVAKSRARCSSAQNENFRKNKLVLFASRVMKFDSVLGISPGFFVVDIVAYLRHIYL